MAMNQEPHRKAAVRLMAMAMPVVRSGARFKVFSFRYE
jgi:hypothetical protein